MTDMKMPTSWHEQNLAAQREYVVELERELARITRIKGEEIRRMKVEIDVSSAQVKRANREGREAFDADTYNVRRK